MDVDMVARSRNVGTEPSVYVMFDPAYSYCTKNYSNLSSVGKPDFNSHYSITQMQQITTTDQRLVFIRTQKYPRGHLLYTD